MLNLRRPSITGPTLQAQMEQIRNYLNTTADQLNFVLNDIDRRLNDSNGTAKIGTNASVYSATFIPNLPEGIKGGNYIVLGTEKDRTFLFVSATRLWVGRQNGKVIEWSEK